MDSTNDVYRTLNTVKEMLSDRSVDTSLLDSISMDEVKVLCQNKSSQNVFQIKVNDHMKLIYYLNTKFKIQELRKFIQPSDEKSTIILIFKEKINNFNHKNVDEFENIDLQIFTMKELLFNISKHSLVPKHEVIKDENEIEELVNKFNLKNKLQFPIILKTDPMAKYMNIQSGQLMKISRISPSSGDNIVYRCCV